MLVEMLQRVLSIAAPLAVTIGVILALLQLQNQNRLRQLEIVMRLYSTFGQENFIQYYNRIAAWDYATYEQYRERGSQEDATALLVVGVFFENMGLLLKRKLAPIDLLDDLLSSPILESWPRVQPIAQGMREEHGHPAWFEWYEFLYDSMAKRISELGGIRPGDTPGPAKQVARSDAVRGG
jgi:hypothetical protein